MSLVVRRASPESVATPAPVPAWLKSAGMVLAMSAIAGFGPGVAPATAAGCGEDVQRDGCVGPNAAAWAGKPPVSRNGSGDAVVARKPVPAAPVYESPATVTCAAGVWRAGCAGPNGTVIQK